MKTLLLLVSLLIASVSSASVISVNTDVITTSTTKVGFGAGFEQNVVNQISVKAEVSVYTENTSLMQISTFEVRDILTSVESTDNSFITVKAGVNNSSAFGVRSFAGVDYQYESVIVGISGRYLTNNKFDADLSIEQRFHVTDDSAISVKLQFNSEYSKISASYRF